jgi:exonuclease VII large subunit
MKSAAAAHAVAPHLQELERQNAELRNHLAREVRRNLDQRLAEAVPNFREIDRDPRWLQWLTGRDALSGQIRQQLLDDAVAKGNAGQLPAGSSRGASWTTGPSCRRETHLHPSADHTDG